MADAAQLKLQVRLDLAFFRAELGKVATAASAYYYPINLLINKKNLTTQLEAIGRNLGAKKYRIDLADTSVVEAAKKVDDLAVALKKLSGSIQIDFNAGGGTKPIGTAMKEMAAKLAKESKGDIDEAVRRMVEMRGAAPFGKGVRGIPGFTAAAKGMGIESAFKLFFQELNQVDPQGLKKALDDGSVMMMQENREIKQKFDKIQSSAESLARDLRAMGEAAQATGKASLSDGGKTLYPQNYGLKIASLLGQIEKLDKELKRVSAASGVELLDNLKELSYALRATSNSFVGIAGFSDTLDATLKGFNTATQAAARATNAYTDRIRRRGGVEYGPSPQRLLTGSMAGGALAVSGQQQNPYKIIEVQVRNAFDIIEDYHKRQVANFTNSYKKIIDEYHRSVLASTARLGVRGVDVTDLGTTGRPMLPGRTQGPLMLPAAGGTTPRSQMPLHSVSTGAYVGQPPFMRAPSVPPSMATGGGQPPIPPSGGRGGSSGFGGFANAMAGIKLPGAGLVSELGAEFAMAAKQVLLFGTAYKALAFLTDFPGKVGEAIGQLQTFRNTLTAITGNSQEFGKSNKFILDLVEKYNVPLQSARDGFTKLYASMAPAGFKGDEIRNIFTGISQGAATFGMSADKVDRVNYAFAQMASKGQVMSEELKGQLGDVLPGAVAIFAEAAGFTGPEALVKFTKAMEDGRYKGAAMKQLLINVGTVMNKEFGPGAEGAARTFQGLMNRMQNATLKLYEAFEPMAIGFANKVVLPMTEGLKVAADGFNAFFTGQQAVTKGGAELAAKLQELRPTFEGLASNAKAVADRVIDLSKAFVPLLELGAKLLATPLAGFLAQTYVSVLLLNSAFTALGGRFAVASMVAYFARLNTALVLTQAQMIATGGAANAMSLRMLAAGSASVGAASATTQLTLALRAMWVAMTGPVGLGVAALAAVTAAAYLMNKPFKEYIDSMPARFANFWRDLQSQATVSISKVIAIWQYLATVTSETFQSMTSGASALYDGLVGALGPFAPWFGNMMQWLKNAWVETIAFMVNQSNPVLGIAKMLGVDVGKTLAVNLTKDRNLPPPGQFTPAGGVSFDAQGIPVGASLSPFIPGSGVLPPIPGTTGDGGRGSKEADKALKAEKQTQEKLRSLQREIELATQLTTLKELQFEAEMSGDKELQIRLQGEERGLGILHATASALDGVTDSRVRQKELAKAEVNMVASRLNMVFNLARLDEERTKSFEDVIADLNLELALKKATTEQARQQLRLEAERMKLVKQKLFTPEQISAIMQRKGELARPQTDAEKTQAYIDALREKMNQLTNPANTIIGIAESIGTSFGDAFKGIITGSMTAQEALAGFFQNLSNYFADMVSKMIAEYLKMQVIKGLTSLLPGLGGMFGGGGGGLSDLNAPGNINNPLGYANGGLVSGGFRAFATGGIVTGPTLGLVGEGRYNEAVIPLPDGKSVPVDLGGMSSGMSSAPITVNVSVDAKGSEVQGDNAQGAALGRAIAASVQSELIKQKRPGGLLAK